MKRRRVAEIAAALLLGVGFSALLAFFALHSKPVVEHQGRWRRPIRLHDQLLQIRTFTPSSGSASDGVTISGVGFYGVTSVDFNGTTCSYTVLNQQTIAAIVPNGATTGPLHVVTSHGTATSLTNFTVVAGFAFDLTTSTLPTNITVARTGGDVYAERTPSTVVKYNTATQQGVYECDDNGACGWRSFGPYSNDVVAPFNFADVSWVLDHTPTVTHNDVVSPDGVTLADRVTTPAGQAGLNTGFVGAASPTTTTMSTIWVLDSLAAPPSPTPGVFAVFPSYNNSGITTALTSFGTNATWHREYVYWYHNSVNAGQSLAFSPAGATITAGNVSWNAGATGGVDVWGAQTTAIQLDFGRGTNPFVNGSTSALVMSVNPAAFGNLLNAGDFHLEGAVWEDPSVTEMSVNLDATSPYYFDMVDAVHGDTYIRWGQQDVFQWFLNGALMGSINIGPQYNGTIGPAQLKWEIWSRPSDNKSGFQLWINGARSAVGTVAGAGVQAFVPTAMYLGSNGGTQGWLDRRHALLRTTTHNENAGEGLVFGDSITSNYLSAHVMMASEIYSIGQVNTRPGLISYATPGERCDQQQTRYDGAAQKGQSYITWVYLLCGINNITQGQTAATVIAQIQAFVTDINTNNPTARVLLAPITPAEGNVGAPNWTTATTVNNAILGGGITGTNLIVLPYWTDFDAGFHASGVNNGVLYGPYDSGDGLHQNNTGMSSMSSTVHSTLVANGLLN